MFVNQEPLCCSAPSWINLQQQQVRLAVVQVPTCHLTGNAEEKKKTDPVRVVGVPESGNNLSLKRTKVEPYFTATFPSWRTSAQHLDDSRKVPNPPKNWATFSRADFCVES